MSPNQHDTLHATTVMRMSDSIHPSRFQHIDDSAKKPVTEVATSMLKIRGKAERGADGDVDNKRHSQVVVEADVERARYRDDRTGRHAGGHRSNYQDDRGNYGGLGATYRSNPNAGRELIDDTLLSTRTHAREDRESRKYDHPVSSATSRSAGAGNGFQDRRPSHLENENTPVQGTFDGGPVRLWRRGSINERERWDRQINTRQSEQFHSNDKDTRTRRRSRSPPPENRRFSPRPARPYRQNYRSGARRAQGRSVSPPSDRSPYRNPHDLRHDEGRQRPPRTLPKWWNEGLTTEENFERGWARVPKEYRVILRDCVAPIYRIVNDETWGPDKSPIENMHRFTLEIPERHRMHFGEYLEVFEKDRTHRSRN